MKKKVKTIVVAMVFMSMFMTTLTYAADTSNQNASKMYINGVLNEPDVGAMVLDDYYVMVPLRVIAEALGYYVCWGGHDQIRLYDPNGDYSVVTIGNQEFWTYGRPSMSVNAPFIYQNRAMISIWAARNIFAHFVEELDFDFERNVLVMVSTT